MKIKSLFILLILAMYLNISTVSAFDITISSPLNTTYPSTDINLIWSSTAVVTDALYDLNGEGNISFISWFSQDIDISSGLSSIQGIKSIFQKDGTYYLIATKSVTHGYIGYNWTGSTWQLDTAIVSGLPTSTVRHKAEVFYMSGTWYLINGDDNGVFQGYNWTGSTWQSDSAIISNLGDVGTMASPTVFQKGGTWYLIAGEWDGVFNGFNWTGSTWQSDSAIISNLGDVGSYSTPHVFQKDGTWYLFTGNGLWNGVGSYKWTGSTWQGNTAIQRGIYAESNSYVIPIITAFEIDGLWYSIISSSTQDVKSGFRWTGSAWSRNGDISTGLGLMPSSTATDSYSYPTVFEKDGTWYMISGNHDGIFNGFNWTGSYWQRDTVIESGLGDIGLSSKPTVFEMSGTWYLISGKNTGIPSGFRWTGSTWQSYSSIISGLPSIAHSKPTVFEKYGTWYLILGTSTGTLIGYNWSGSAWQSDSAIVSGVASNLNGLSPEVFEKDGTYYLMGVGGSFVASISYVWSNNQWVSANIHTDILGNWGITIFDIDDIWYSLTGTDTGYFIGQELIYSNASLVAQWGANNVTLYVQDATLGWDSLTRYFTVACIPNPVCSIWSSCYIEFGNSVKQRMCYDANNCSANYVEKTSCGIVEDVSGEGFYSSTPPDSFSLVPYIVVPSTENNEPNINSQTITGFSCFTNWYGYGDNTLDRMEYTINNITTTVYPNESFEPCGKGLDCPKPFGYIQTWDYIDDYFTQYDDYNTTIELVCYGTDLSSETLTINLNPKEENYCHLSSDGITKECFSFSDSLNNHIYSATDINLKPTFAFDLGRIITTENTPDWQMYRVTTDVVNYFSDELHTNDAKDPFNKIAQKEGYQIIELFTTPEDKAQVYFDFYTEDIYPKYFTLTDSDGQIQILIMFYNNEVYYFDGYAFKSLGDYALNTPYTVEVDFDVDNQRFKIGLNTWHIYPDDSYNIFSWKKIGVWQYDSKIGTFVTRYDDAKDIKYFAFTIMSEFCNTDSDCSSIYGSQSYYGGSTTTSPAFSDDWGFKQIKEHLYATDGSYLRYYDDAQTSNTGLSTINTWDGLVSGDFNNESIISLVWKSEDAGWLCFGEINKTIDIYAREGTDSWTLQDTLIITPATTSQTYITTVSIPFDQVKLDFVINGGTCFGSSRGTIDVDSIKAINITNSSGGECRDIDWFAETFTNTSGNLEWAFNKSMNNSDFMLEWDDEIYENLKLDDSIWNGGYCYSDMLIDNIETYTTRSTFHASEESLKEITFTYEWLEKLGWNPDGTQGDISGESGAYVSDYYNWDVCTKDGRQFNKGTWCMINVHAQVLWDIAIGYIYGNVATFFMFLLLLMGLSTFIIMIK